MGCTGEFAESMGESEFLKYISTVFDARGLRHSRLTGRILKKVALCGGSGGDLISDAIAAGADVFVTAEIKYHNFIEAGENILLADIGHFESEKFATEILYDLIIKKFPKFALRFSETNTNPINYLKYGKD